LGISRLGSNMPDILRTIEFTEQLLAEVQEFQCGTQDWETPLAMWIKAAPNVKDGALYEIHKRKGTLQVWLYVNEKGELVGYGSLGASNWQWPTADDARVPINVIPNVAIQQKFWGKPRDDPPKYSTQIFNHLIFQARQHPERHALLGLFVDPRNLHAIKAYKSAGFEEYFRKCPGDEIEYQSMLLKLAP
jgi:hypothetical protein